MSALQKQKKETALKGHALEPFFPTLHLSFSPSEYGRKRLAAMVVGQTPLHSKVIGRRFVGRDLTYLLSFTELPLACRA